MKPITEKEFNQVVNFIKSKYGVNLSNKKALVIGRLQNYVEQSGFNSFSEYLEVVMSDKTGSAITTLINKVTTNHTYFMREPDHFNFFQNAVLPYLEKTESSKKDLRIWSAGCSTGEEPYTIAMIIDEYFGTEKSLWNSVMLATDISTKVLETACNGIYPNESIEVLPQKWKNTYFKKINEEKSSISDKIKKEVVFKKFNLMGGNGASSFLANYHYHAWKFGTEEDTLNKFSTDIVKLNKFGFCFNTLDFLFNNDLPKDLNKYEMFSEPLYSPCEGEVWSVEDGNDDLDPSKNELYVPSNNIVIKYKENYYIALHHLKKESIKVALGDKVKQGQLLGEIGNSGNTTIPHLHIQVWKNEGTTYLGVPINFNGSFPVKNKVYFK